MATRLLSGRFFALFFVVSLVSALDTVVDLDYAKYRGQSPSNGTVEWLGIQYAAPPVGNLRFAAPQDPEKKDGTQSANQVGFSFLIYSCEHGADWLAARPCLHPD